MPKVQNPTIVFLEQQTKAEYWDWAAAESSERTHHGTIIDNRLGISLGEAQRLVEQGSAHELGEYLVNRLEHVGDFFHPEDPQACEDHPGLGVAEAYIIVHDKDEKEVWSESEQAYGTVPVARHIHMMLKFKDRKSSAPRAYIAKRLGITEHQLEPPKSGKHSWDNNLAYLIHIKDEEKYQYSPTEVATIRGRDYMEIFAERRSAWMKGRAHSKMKRASESIEDLREKILTGQVTKTQIMVTDELYEVYGRHRKICDEALSTYEERQEVLKTVEMRQNLGTLWRKSTLTIMGPSGSGKGVLSNAIAADLQRFASKAGRDWALAEPPGRNALENVGTAEVINHDDARWHLLPEYDDYLRHMDPYRSTETARRHKNGAAPVVRVILLTSSETLPSFALAAKARKHPGELMADEKKHPANLDEFLRRVTWHVEVTLPPEVDVEDFPAVRAGMLVSMYKVRKAAEARTERVYSRDGDLLGDMRTERYLEFVGLIKGVEHAARFLAGSVMTEHNPDVVQELPDDIRGELISEHSATAFESLQEHGLIGAQQERLTAGSVRIYRCRDCRQLRDLSHERHTGDDTTSGYCTECQERHAQGRLQIAEQQLQKYQEQQQLHQRQHAGARERAVEELCIAVRNPPHLGLPA